jgi:hypothetical protein
LALLKVDIVRDDDEEEDGREEEWWWVIEVGPSISR